MSVRMPTEPVTGQQRSPDLTTTGTAGVSVRAADLARVLGNALLFVREGGPVQRAIVSVYQDRVCVTGTDGYTAGTDHAKAVEPRRIPDGGFTLLVARSALAELCGSAAAADGALRVVVSEPATLALCGPGEKQLVAVMWTEDPQGLDLYRAVADLIALAENDRGAAGVAHVDSAMMARFREVRSDRPNRRAELRATGNDRPILVRVGPTFRGLLMPVLSSSE